MIAGAVVFLIVLLVIRNISSLSNIVSYNNQDSQNGLTYNKAAISDLISQDSDGDGVPDWEESLWGTDPYKKDTNGDGIPDNVEIEKMKKAKGMDDTSVQSDANLTQTDKFSQELFTTVAALNQNGVMDQSTIDTLSSSLADKIQNSNPRKVYVSTDIKVTTDESIKSITNYNNALDAIHTKYPVQGNVMDIFQRFNGNQDTPNPDVLAELTPIIKQTSNIISELSKLTVPKSLASLHLAFINSLEQLVENMSDIQQYNSDAIISLSGISQYEQNMNTLQSANTDLVNAIKTKLGN